MRLTLTNRVGTFKDVDPQQYLTVSKYGIVHFENGMAEYTSTIKFIKEIHIFERLRKVRFGFYLHPDLWRG